MTAAPALPIDKLIPAWLQPAVVMDLLLARDINIKNILAESALLPIDKPLVNRHISATNYDRLLLNGEKVWPGDDFAFQLGHRLYRQGLGPLSELLNEQIESFDFVGLLSRFQKLICPTLSCHPTYLGDKKWFLLMRSATSNKIPPVLQHSAMTVFSHLIRHNGSTKEPHFLLRETKHGVENFHTHLGANCHFNLPFSGILLHSSSSSESLIKFKELGMTKRVAYEQCLLLCNERNFFIDELSRQLRSKAHDTHDLQTCSAHFGISPATLKRRLKHHGMSFQEFLDSIRSEQAQIDLILKGASVDNVCERLNFHDNSNFRRAFKRWTGKTPMALKEKYSDFIKEVSASL